MVWISFNLSVKSDNSKFGNSRFKYSILSSLPQFPGQESTAFTIPMANAFR